MEPHALARVAALIGEPARSAMLLALLDGRALTALELARCGGVAAPTASRHLAQLVEAGLLSVQAQGRHRYHRLASADVARALEALMQVPVARPMSPATGPRDAALRLARRCYDHLGGRLAVAITEHLLHERALEFDGDAALPLPRLPAVLARLGLAGADLAAPGRRVLCRPCLDWSERRPHAAGRLGALICSHCVEAGWLRRSAESRVMQITPRGAAALRDWLGLRAWQQVVDAGR
ncbi:MAG: winged helix-turn-helix transcriptional regulator [Piscinibacter sp.]|nr:winged helix-turn-helix transcriptional regulator [Piscinibacter sp.]